MASDGSGEDGDTLTTSLSASLYPLDDYELEPLSLPYVAEREAAAAGDDDQQRAAEDRVLVQQVRRHVEKHLQQYRRFGIHLPSSVFHEAPQVDLFQTEVANEMETLARDPSTGRQMRLGSEQLAEIFRNGTLTIESRQFPGKQHVWKLSLLLINARTRIVEAWRRGLGFALDHLITEIPARLWSGNTMSLPKALSNLLSSVRDLVRLKLGIAERSRRYSDFDIERRLMMLCHAHMLAHYDLAPTSLVFDAATPASIEAAQQLVSDGSSLDDHLYAVADNAANATTTTDGDDDNTMGAYQRANHGYLEISSSIGYRNSVSSSVLDDEQVFNGPQVHYLGKHLVQRYVLPPFLRRIDSQPDATNADGDANANQGQRRDAQEAPAALDMRMCSPSLMNDISPICNSIVDSVLLAWRHERHEFIAAQFREYRARNAADSSSSTATSGNETTGDPRFIVQPIEGQAVNHHQDGNDNEDDDDDDDNALGDVRHLTTEAQYVLRQCIKHLHRRVLDAIMASDALRREGGNTFPQLLVSQIELARACRRADNKVQREEQAATAAAQSDVQSHWWSIAPDRASKALQSRLSLYREANKLARWQHTEREIEQLIAARSRELEHSTATHGDDDVILREFQASLYLARRAHEFHRTQAEQIRENLTKQQQPARIFDWGRIIWRPSNWLIKRRDDGSYYAESMTRNIVSSDCFAWRWRIVLLRSFVWLSNWNYRWLLLNLWHGPIGLRALFSLAPFYPVYKVCRKSGLLKPNKHVERLPLVELLRRLGQSASRSIAAFEALPDSGLLGKNISRVFNRIWNYGIVLGLGSLMLVLGMPLLVAVNVVVSSFMIATSIVTVPVVSMLKYYYNMYIYDTEAPIAPVRTWKPAVPLLRICTRVVLGSVGNVVGATAMAVVGHPVIAAASTVASSALAAVRTVYDWTMYYLVLKPVARVPVSDSPLARRIAGPGLSFSYYRQIEKEQALALLQLELEWLELQWAKNRLERKINEPLVRYQRLASTLLRPLAWECNANHEELSRQTNELLRELSDAFDSCQVTVIRRSTNDALQSLSNVRQTPEALASTMLDAERLVQRFVTTRLFRLMEDYGADDGEDAQTRFWALYNVAPGDWAALTRSLLKERFGSMFLVPLEPGDTSIKLEVMNAGEASNFVEMVAHGTAHDDLERFITVVTERVHDLTQQAEANTRELLQTVSSCNDCSRGLYANVQPFYRANSWLHNVSVLHRLQLLRAQSKPSQ